MLTSQDCFRGGRLDRDALVGFIKDIKKNTKLSDEDAAVMAASKVITYTYIFRKYISSLTFLKPLEKIVNSNNCN